MSFLDKFKDIEIKKAEDTNKVEENENYSIEDILKTDVKSKKKEEAIRNSRNDYKKENKEAGDFEKILRKEKLKKKKLQLKNIKQHK